MGKKNCETFESDITANLSFFRHSQILKKKKKKKKKKCKLGFKIKCFWVKFQLSDFLISQKGVRLGK